MKKLPIHSWTILVTARVLRKSKQATVTNSNHRQCHDASQLQQTRKGAKPEGRSVRLNSCCAAVIAKAQETIWGENCPHTLLCIPTKSCISGIWHACIQYKYTWNLCVFSENKQNRCVRRMTNKGQTHFVLTVHSRNMCPPLLKYHQIAYPNSCRVEL